MSENEFSHDAFTNAISNATTTQHPGRYVLEIAEVKETGTPCTYRCGDFYDPFEPDGDSRVGEADPISASASEGDFASEQEALDYWVENLARSGVAAELSDGPGDILAQQGPCYKLTDAKRQTSYVILKLDRIKIANVWKEF